MSNESAQVAVLFISLYALGFGVYYTKVFSDYQKKRLKDETGHDWSPQMSFFGFLVCLFWPVMFLFTITGAFLSLRWPK